METLAPVGPIETDAARSMLDQLLDDSRLYRKGADYQNLLDFVVRLRNFAPFNALLLQIQKPGLNHAATARDWRENFGRSIKGDARPLVRPVFSEQYAREAQAYQHMPGYGAGQGIKDVASTATKFIKLSLFRLANWPPLLSKFMVQVPVATC